MNQAELAAVQRAFDATITRMAERNKSESKALVAELRAENTALVARVAAVETENARLAARTAMLEAQAKDYAFRDREIWDAATDYLPGDWVTHDGALWKCKAPARGQRPGDSKGCWTLRVKRGRPGRNADGSRGDGARCYPNGHDADHDLNGNDAAR
jgi:hypothetical protein